MTKRYNPSYKEGLNNEQVKERVKNNLVNFDNQPKTKSIKEILRGNIFTYFNCLNTIFGASIILTGVFSGEMFVALKNCLFMGVMFFNTVISIVQEILSKKTIDKLSVIAESKVKVIRNGKEELISINEIVLDDIIKLETGNQTVVDGIIEDGKVEVNESFITGEEEAVSKDKKDMILSGSFIVSGQCFVKVEHVGSDNYISSISNEAKYIKQTNSVILNAFTRMLKILSLLLVPLGIALFINQLGVTSNNISESIFATVAALIGMIPEGLVLLTSSVMAVSVIKLSRYHVLVQELYCIETLARVNVICLDKTGTLTEGLMEVKDIINYSKDDLDKVLSTMVNTFNDTSPTFTAIRNKYKAEKFYEAEDIMPFSSSRKFSAIKLEDKGTYYLGAPEFILRDDIDKIKKEIEKYQNEYRVLIIGHNENEIEERPKNITVEGLILIQDKIRKEAKDTIKYFKNQKVKVKIISGDNVLTVNNIAKRIGLNDLKCIDMTTVGNDNIKDIVEDYDVFGRVTPHQKKLLVIALKEKGNTVAMTGDGVNDVLALKEADCSVAMASGSEAARNVSQLVLLDSNFDSMPKIVREGRQSINNIERSSSLLLVKTIYTILLIFCCISLSAKYFFIPIQLTLITMFTIGIPSFILTFEPNNNIVKDKFLPRVVSRSIPAGITVVFSILIVLILKLLLNLSEEVSSLLMVSLTSTVAFMFLFNLCKPFNLFKKILISFLILGFTYCAIFYYEFFNLAGISITSILLYIVTVILSRFIFIEVTKATKYITKKVYKI